MTSRYRAAAHNGRAKRTLLEHSQASTSGNTHETSFTALSVDLILLVLRDLDSPSLAAVNATCKTLRVWLKAPGLRLVEKVARDKLVRLCGRDDAERWRHATWLERLHIEESAVGFDQERCFKHGFRFTHEPTDRHPAGMLIKLEGMGPKLLVSDLSTAEQPLLRWKLCVRGNTAVEFGIVPLALQESHKSLHKCHNVEEDAERPTGFSSTITVGSQLPFKVPIMKGSVVEVMARRGHIAVLVTNPPDGQELYWHNTRTVPKPYRGPRELRLETSFPDTQDIKLAVTCWAFGSFEALHPLCGPMWAASAPPKASPPLSHTASQLLPNTAAPSLSCVASPPMSRTLRQALVSAPSSPASEDSSQCGL